MRVIVEKSLVIYWVSLIGNGSDFAGIGEVVFYVYKK